RHSPPEFVGFDGWCLTVSLTPDRRDRLVYEAPQRPEHRSERCQAALEAAWRADAEERPHPEAQIEGAGMHEQPLEHVLVPAHVRAPQTTGLIGMRTRSLEQFASFPEKAFSTVAADPTSIRVNRVAFRLLLNPRLWPATGLADIGANLQRLQIV